MRTTVDIPNDLMERAIAVSGARNKRAAVCWALEEAVRAKAVADLLAHRVTIDFAVTPEQLEAREIKAQYGERKRRRHG